ncbi:ATP-binding protein [Lentilactobacillus kisonensis]|uniref:ATPase n=1 Tax=Lentilactobacillus kisonensis DSM 19906 = JCM 15041 TaxID=1423766 RepID=A0A0R1NRP4_9LACO|nr:ATP-binding protein [Lentilactobacillus kisonensis]KRL22758.1 ATPase [Lentilactobacillus kisonensis DSM 19906 = JCM 15041]
MIERPLYMNRLKAMINTEFVKVITGVRRSGKSFLLLMLRDYLEEQGISKDQIIYVNFENPAYFEMFDYRSLYAYLKDKVNSNQKTYFLFDEIQEVSEWQKLINGLRVAYDSDIYVTGSNASLLSGELGTYLTGRYVELKMLPLSFQEYLAFKDLDAQQKERYFSDYLEYGGFPSVVLQDDKQLKDDVLNGVYSSILLRDVANRASIKEPELLERIALYLLDNIGQLISTNKIANTIRSSGRKISNNTVENYINLLVKSFLFYKAPRYDIRGKEYISSQSKYYVVDLGFVRSQLQKRNTNRGSRIENLVFLELKRRRYNVFVGRLGMKEIDFVATNADETIYVQVTDHIPENNERETANLLQIATGYKRVLITNSWSDVGEYEGIPIIHVVDFLGGRKL